MIIDCVYKPIVWGVIGDVYVCEASVKYPDDDDRVVEVRGTHNTGKSNFAVEGLHIYNQIVIRLPKDIHRFFPSLKGIVFNHANLHEITATAQ